MRRAQKAQKDVLVCEGALAAHIQRAAGPFNAASLAQSYGLPVDRVRQIITRNGGSHAE